MRCCVTGCKNDSRTCTKSQGITFHVFPVEPTLRAAWLRAIGKDTWQPKERSAVCSDHFLWDDLYETRRGHRRKIRVGAVPVVLLDSEAAEYGDPASLKACRVCLITNAKLYPLRSPKLEQAYENLTGVSLCEDTRLPQKLCVECAQRLLNCNQFRTKSLRANLLMSEILKKHQNITINNLKAISRENNQLTSPLATKHYAPDHTDLVLCEEKEAFDISTNDIKEHDFETENDVKDESVNEIFLHEFGDDRIDAVSIGDRIDDDKEFDTADLDDNIDLEIAQNADLEDIKNEKKIEDKTKEEAILENDNEATNETSTDDELPRSVLRSRLQEKRCKKQKEGQKKVQKKKKIQKQNAQEPKIDRRKRPFLNNDLSETLFTITELTYEEQIAEINQRKESANYKNGIFKCEECFKGFLDEDAYNSHMTRHTTACGAHRCGVCGAHFRHGNALRKHATAHHTQAFGCTRCPYRTTHRQSARLHERWHNGTTYACPRCPDRFVKFTTYMGHLRIKHPSDFVCQLCGYSFVSEKGISLHKKLKHRLDSRPIPEDGPYCELCDIRFIDADALRRHTSVSAKHTSAGTDARAPNTSSKWNRGNGKERDKRAKETEDEDRKVYPSQTRRAEGPIPCEQCGLQLEDSRAYHGHFRRMHPDKNRTKYPSMKSPCMCEVCGRMFQSYALLKDHRWTHTGERPFRCDACGKCFRMRQRLVAHRRVHSERRPAYACALCGKHFSTHSNRQRHMFIHTGLKPYKCEMCGKGFKHVSEKRAHITYVHLKKPWPKRSRCKRRPDTRQVLMQQASVAPPVDIGLQQVWPCDPKLQETHEKSYYALKM